MLKILSSTARVAVTALVLSGFFVASTIGAPGYIKIGDMSAGSEEEGHKPFDVMSFEWGGQGEKWLTVVLDIDKSSPGLRNLCSVGRIQNAQFTEEKRRGAKKSVYNLKNIAITCSGTRVTFNYGCISPRR